MRATTEATFKSMIEILNPLLDIRVQDRQYIKLIGRRNHLGQLHYAIAIYDSEADNYAMFTAYGAVSQVKQSVVRKLQTMSHRSCGSFYAANPRYIRRVIVRGGMRVEGNYQYGAGRVLREVADRIGAL